MKGLYICKTYWAYSSEPKKIFPVLKYGMTGNINTRMKYYNNNGTYKLLAFFPCNDIKFREYLVQKDREEYRLTRSEHEQYYKGLFKELYNQVKNAANVKITRKRDKRGVLVTTIGDYIHINNYQKK